MRPRFHDATIALLLAGLALLVIALVWGDLVIPIGGAALRLPYKTVARALAIVWVVLVLVPSERVRLPYRRCRGDLPLALFALVAALSVALGGGHWGDVRSLLAGIGVGGLARSLFAPPPRRALVLHYLGATIVLILVRELVAHPDLLPAHEAARYALVTANPNPLGFIFAMPAALFLAEALGSTAPGAGDTTTRVAAALYYAAAVLGTLLTFSRSAALGLAVGSAIVVLAAPARRTALVVAALAAAAFLAVQRPDAWIRARGPGDTDRPRIMRTSLSLVREAPLLGIGFGINNLEERFPARYEELYGERLFRFHSANQLVDLLVGTGIVGTALAVWWAVELWRDARGRLRRTTGTARVRAAGALAALVAIVLMSVNEPPLYAGKVVPLLFVVLAAVQLGPADGSADRDGW